MKFCKDCRHYQPSAYNANAWKYARCLHDPKREQNVVTGEWSEVVQFCDSTRLLSERCGPDAKWFEPREDAEAAQ